MSKKSDSPRKPAAEGIGGFKATNQALQGAAKAQRRNADRGRNSNRSGAGHRREALLATEIALKERNLPNISVPKELPISEHCDELIALIKNNQVVIVCGETGSGKSTQLPKICVKAGFGINGLIGHTQPRRIAARSIASRISDELQSPLGNAVGYRVRFSEIVNPSNYIRVLTDGMLLSEFHQDRNLRRYEVVIIDEAHERSLNIDFLLGLLKQLLKKRPELKLVVTSATLDSDAFSQYFDDAPVVLVSGRTYPVEVRYQVQEAIRKEEENLNVSIENAISELHQHRLGDVLVFLPGEREIREATEHLSKNLKSGIDILLLYARLTPNEQARIFAPGTGTKVVLATNVAETSLTVPGIKYVVDSGLARVSRYSPTRKIQRLPIEKISQSAANQRAGRCGRISDGICIRLYDEDDFLNRPEYTDPEIKRTSLADVILRMQAMLSGGSMRDIDSFPFLDRPERNQINDGIKQLLELGALDSDGKLTTIGRSLSYMPVDPRVGRVLIEASRLECLTEIVTIAAALSIPDPRLVPADKQQHARQHHRQMSEEQSDFLILLDIWNQFREIQKTVSKRQAFRWCEENFLSVFRMREWIALQANLIRLLKKAGYKLNSKKAKSDKIHQALLSGLLSNIALFEKPSAKLSRKEQKKANYQGTFGKQLKIFPASVYAGQSPKWIMSAEQVETNAVYARTVASISPSWIESHGNHLLQYNYSEPQWSVKQERVFAFKRGTLYGITIFSGRRCDFSNVDIAQSRGIFIRRALVDGEFESRLKFVEHNLQMMEDMAKLEHKFRRRDLLEDEEVVYQFYDELLPGHINSGSALRKWYRRLPEEQKLSLLMNSSMLLKPDVSGQLDGLQKSYPDYIEDGGVKLPLVYQFHPGKETDGVTARLTLPLLNQINASIVDRIIPGLLRDKLIALAKNLPKSKRRMFVPIPDAIDRVFNDVIDDRRPLLVALSDWLGKDRGCDITPVDFDQKNLPAYLKLKIELVDENDNVLAVGDNVAELQGRFEGAAQSRFAKNSDTKIERHGIVKWDFDALPKSVEVLVGDQRTKGYPALVDCGASVSIKIFDTPDKAEVEHIEGTRRLIFLNVPEHRKLMKKPIPNWQSISLLYASIGDLNDLQHTILRRSQDVVFFADGKMVRDEKEFSALVKNHANRVPETLRSIAESVAQTLKRFREVKQALFQHEKMLPKLCVKDIGDQLQWLVYDGFLEDVNIHWLPHIPRFLQGIEQRINHAVLDGGTDQLRLDKVLPHWNRFLATEIEYGETMESYRWLVEEYRISVFAQSLKTSRSVSAKRLDQLWKKVVDESKQG